MLDSWLFWQCLEQLKRAHQQKQRDARTVARAPGALKHLTPQSLREDDFYLGVCDECHKKSKYLRFDEQACAQYCESCSDPRPVRLWGSNRLGL